MAHLVLYDGVCGLCSRSIQFILARDKRDVFHFAAQQSAVGQSWLARFGRDGRTLETLYVVASYDGPSPRLLEKSRAVLFAGRQLGGIFRLARMFEPLPTRWLDGLYGLVAKNRYRVFGRFDSCMLPEPRHRGKFLDAGSPQQVAPSSA